jgi:hypothetical protein
MFTAAGQNNFVAIAMQVSYVDQYKPLEHRYSDFVSSNPGVSRATSGVQQAHFLYNEVGKSNCDTSQLHFFLPVSEHN